MSPAVPRANQKNDRHWDEGQQVKIKTIQQGLGTDIDVLISKSDRGSSSKKNAQIKPTAKPTRIEESLIQ